MKLAHLIVLLPAVPLAAAERPWLEVICEHLSPALGQIDARLDAIAEELPGLPDPVGTPSGVSAGFSSVPMLAPEEAPWVEVTLPEAQEIDTVVLVPAVSMGAGGPTAGFGFPKRFVVEARTEADAEPVVLLDQSAEDFPNPGIYPVIQRIEPRVVQAVRLREVKGWMEDGPSVLALAELMLLSGNRNVAVGAKADASSHRDATTTWRRSNLTDMSTPLGLPAVPDPSATMGYHSEVEMESAVPKQVTLTFAEPIPVDEVRLVPVVREGLPAWASYGFPPRMLVEVADSADFSDARTLWTSRGKDSPAPGRNVVVLPADGAPARHVRVTSQRLWHRAQDFLFALAEVQVFSAGEDVADTAQGAATDVTDEEGWSVAALSDGYAHGERLLELPEWLHLMDRRRQLLQEQAQLLDRRAPILAQAQQLLVRAAGGAGLLLAGTGVFAVWRQKRRNRREQEALRERLARDLHDDIGSNLGSIALLCKIVTRHPDDGQSHHEDFAEIQRIASESADSMREMIALLSPHGDEVSGGDWRQALTRLAERQLHGLELKIDQPPAEVRVGPDLESRRELYLFCKEAFTNIARHADASAVAFTLRLNRNGLDLEIRDNGRGFDPAAEHPGFGLRNLHQRAEQMGGTLDLTSETGKGTTLHLRVPRQRRWVSF